MGLGLGWASGRKGNWALSSQKREEGRKEGKEEGNLVNFVGAMLRQVPCEKGQPLQGGPTGFYTGNRSILCVV